MAEEDSDLRRLLDDFVGPNEVRGQAAFNKLSPRIRAFIKSYLGSFQIDSDLKEDVMAKSLVRLWSNRQNIEIRRFSEWWHYVRTTARNVALDMLPREQVMEIFEDILPHEMDDLDARVENHYQTRQLYGAANRLWLGCGDADSELTRRLLIMQLFYLHGLDWKQVAKSARVTSRARLDSIIESKESFSVLAYAELYGGGREIVNHIMREWSDCESHVPPILRLRYQYGFSVLRIAQKLGYDDVSIIESTLEASLKKLPFCTRMQRLLTLSHPHKSILKEQGILKRLCFQYTVSPSHAYPQNLIWELIGPPSEIAGSKFNPGILNMWLSGGRLFKELKNFMEKEGHIDA